jgi:predicted alpha/beta-hydrolase family hydrolase
MLELETPYGPSRVHLYQAEGPRAALVLGHGAGGGVGAPDLVAARDAALSVGVSVGLVEQPYRVKGRRTPAPARQLDAVWNAVVGQLHDNALSGLSIIAGGRSAGARVACRTAAEVGAFAVLCLAFPVHPPGRGDDPAKSRLPELDAVRVPTLVVQGERDPFGMPPAGAQRTVIRVPGDHALRSTAAVGAAVSEWLAAVSPRRADPPQVSS